MPALIGYDFALFCCLVKGHSMRKRNDFVEFAVDNKNGTMISEDNREIIEGVSDKNTGNQIF